MTTVIKIVLAVVVALALIVGVQKCRDSNARDKATAAETKLEVADSVKATKRDSVKVQAPITAHADTQLTHVLRQPKPPAPRIVYVHDTVPGSVDSAAYVPKADYDTLANRYTLLERSASAYQVAARDMMESQRKLIVAQENVITAARNVIANPRPSSRWSIGIGPGYGFALVKGHLVQAPTGTVTVSYRIF